MTRITEALVRKRAEHNDGILATLEELSLHQSNVEKIELLGHLCKHLRILYLQSNLISKLENLHKLKELEYLNLAVNNLTKVQNLQRCESLQKLDLTVNFLDKAGLLSIASLQCNEHLRELYLLGNPCAEWHSYRPYIVGTLAQLKKLDGKSITPSESIAARQVLPTLQQQLRNELIESGIDPDAAAQVEDDGDEDAEIAETGYRDADGEMRRPWCPATRILEHRESEAQEREAERKREAQKRSRPTLDEPRPQLREDFPVIKAPSGLRRGSSTRHRTMFHAEREVQSAAKEQFKQPACLMASASWLDTNHHDKEGEDIRQKNEGRWDFTLQDTDDSSAVELSVAVGKYLDSSLIKADVQPSCVRLLIKGHLLQLKLPCEVRPDSSRAERSKATGHLLLTMPKESPGATSYNPAYTRVSVHAVPGDRPLHLPNKIQSNTSRSQATGHRADSERLTHKATTHCLRHDDNDEDFLPEL